MTAKLNSMCLNCQHLHTCCDGTTSQVWAGCVIKDADPEDAAAYIEHMTEAIRDDIDPAADLTDEQIINNRFL